MQQADFQEGRELVVTADSPEYKRLKGLLRIELGLKETRGNIDIINMDVIYKRLNLPYRNEVWQSCHKKSISTDEAMALLGIKKPIFIKNRKSTL